MTFFVQVFTYDTVVVSEFHDFGARFLALKGFQVHVYGRA